MKLKELGVTGVQVPELALGTWEYRGGLEPLKTGLELGASFIDTAEAYGTEPVVGQAIRGIRNRVFLASKVSPRHFRRQDVIKAAECSLKQLGTDYLDLYQLHWPNYTVPIGETMAAMEQLVEMGKIRFLGVSNFTVAELRQAQSVLTTTRIVSNQVRYSLLDRTPEDGLLQYCEAEKISLLGFSPFATDFEKMRSCDSGDVLGRVADAVGKTRAQVALSWCLSHSAAIAIFRTNKVEHVKENCTVSGFELSAEHLHLREKGICHRSRNRPQRFVRRLARRISQYAGRNLGEMTMMDQPHDPQYQEC